MILDKVNGEIGMFYHYFKSKDELFQKVVESFFKDYRNHFIRLTINCDSKAQFIERLLEHYEENMVKLNSMAGNMHWTIQYAMSARTIEELKPAIMGLVEKWGCRSKEPLDMVAGQVVYGISATLHAQSFESMSADEKIQVLLELLNRLL